MSETMITVRNDADPATPDEIAEFENPRPQPQEPPPQQPPAPQPPSPDDGTGPQPPTPSVQQARPERRRRERAPDPHLMDRLNRQDQAIQQMAAFIGQMAQQTQQAQAQSLDQQINAQVARFHNADRALQQAMLANDAAGFSRAMAERDDAKDTAYRLAGQRGQTPHMQSQQAPPPQQRAPEPQQAPPNPVAQALANSFLQRHPWCDAKGTDADSKAVDRIFRDMTEQENDNPADPGFWTDLETRVRQQLPHRFGGQQTAGRRGPPMGSANGGTAQVTARNPLTKDRIEAMKSIGWWDDPKMRAEMIKTYREYDQQHGLPN
jgi:hypothetical protein